MMDQRTRTLEALALWGANEDRHDPAESMLRAVKWAVATGATNLHVLLDNLASSLDDAILFMDAREYGDARRAMDDAVFWFSQLRRELGLGERKECKE